MLRVGRSPKSCNAPKGIVHSTMIKNVYDDIASFPELLQAYHDVSLGSQYGSQEIKFWDHLEDNLHDLSYSLLNEDYPPDEYYFFYVYEPKLRKIICIDFPNKVIQRSIYNVLAPRLNAGFINDTYGCIPGRGNYNAAKKVLEWINYDYETGQKWWYVKLDVHKFFYRIYHEVLMELFEKKISDKRLLRLLRHYFCEASMAFGLPDGESDPLKVPQEKMLWYRGITIGGGLSHLAGNLYLDPVDQLAKRTLKIPQFVRGMDDMIYLGNDKSQLHEWFYRIHEELNIHLKLEFNSKTAMRPINQGVEFLGYMIKPGEMKLRKTTSLRMKRRLKARMIQYRDYQIPFEKANATVMSYKALLDGCDSKALKDKIFSELVFTHEGAKVK